MTTYYMRAYAVMKDGTVQYGEISASRRATSAPDARNARTHRRPFAEFTLNARIVSEAISPIASCGFVYSKNTGPEVGGDGCTTLTLDTKESEMKATATSLELGTSITPGPLPPRFRHGLFRRDRSDDERHARPTLPPSPSAEAPTSLTLDRDHQSARYGHLLRLCWSVSNALPTTDDSSVDLSGQAFSHTIADLLPNTLVHIRLPSTTRGSTTATC